jgi:hypothetical protein
MEHIRNLLNHFKEKGDATPRASEDLFAHIEETLLPHLLRIFKKDNTLFAEVEMFPGLKVSWEGTDDEWKLVSMALMHSVLHGNPAEKFGKILETVKGLIPGGQTDEISKILEDEETQSSLQEMLELVMSTRLVGVVSEIVQSVNFEDLDIDFENPEKLMEMMRDPQSSPVLQELMTRAKNILEDRIRTGKINQQELIREIETIRAKFQSSFGKFLNEMIIGEAGGNTTGNTAQQILSSHPDARRARMLARLQKKQREKQVRK